MMRKWCRKLGIEIFQQETHVLWLCHIYYIYWQVLQSTRIAKKKHKQCMNQNSQRWTTLTYSIQTLWFSPGHSCHGIQEQHPQISRRARGCRKRLIAGMKHVQSVKTISARKEITLPVIIPSLVHIHVVLRVRASVREARVDGFRVRRPSEQLIVVDQAGDVDKVVLRFVW